MNNSNPTFHYRTENRLQSLFSLLPEVFFWTVVVTRLFIALPLFLAAQVHFAFLQSTVLISLSSLVSVLVVESVLTLPSLSTAFFKQFGMRRYQSIAFLTTIGLGIFNQLLIVLAWKDTGMSREAFFIYTVLNTASIVLAEFIGFMTTTQLKMREAATASIATSNGYELPQSSEKVAQILSLPEPPTRKIMLLYQEGLTQGEIAQLVGLSRATVNRKLQVKEVPEGEE